MADIPRGIQEDASNNYFETGRLKLVKYLNFVKVWRTNRSNLYNSGGCSNMAVHKINSVFFLKQLGITVNVRKVADVFEV